MLPVDRQGKVVRYVQKKGKTTVEELAAQFSVSSATIRRDVDVLSEQRLIRKAYGCVLAMDYALPGEIPIQEKSSRCREEKQKIGRTAAGFVADGDTIIIDSGTTTRAMAEQLTGSNLTVITNDLQIALAMERNPTAAVYLAGGLVEKSVGATIGTSVVEWIRSFRVKTAFIGADAIDPKQGVSDRTLEDVAIKRAMAGAAERTIVLADHTKFGDPVFARVGLLDRIDALITDRISDEMKAEFEKAGVKVIA